MTVEEQRYQEECKKVLDGEKMDVVSMAINYGLQISEIRKVVQSNQNAECMKAIVFGMMEGIDSDVLDFLCRSDFNRYQIKEIIEGISHDLTFEQVKTYAFREMSASRMKIMRKQLEDTMQEKIGQGKDDDSVKEYMKGLMEIMETSIQQFRESNERFDALSSLVKEHVVDEKNRELQDLYENLKYKDRSIQDLQRRLADREKRITELENCIKKRQEEKEAGKGGEKLEMLFSSDTKTVSLQGGVSLDIEGSAEQKPSKRRMIPWLSFRDKSTSKDVLSKIMETDLSPEQLEEVRMCLESGLTDQEIERVLECDPTPERMKKMREILLLMKKRKGGST